MADTEFEEFRKTTNGTFSNRIKSTTPFYTLVPEIIDDDYQSSKSDSSDLDDETLAASISIVNHVNVIDTANAKNSDEDDEIGDGLKTFNGHQTEIAGDPPSTIRHTADDHPADPSVVPVSTQVPSTLIPYGLQLAENGFSGQIERRRRKLPEIPKNKKSSLLSQFCPSSLADELSQRTSSRNNSNAAGFISSGMSARRSVLSLKCGYLMDEDSSPDSDRLTSLGDVDSGHSTAHSPTEFKSISPTQTTHQSPQSPFPPPFGGIPYSQIEMLEATHRGLHKFIPRHHDEIEVEIGDPLYVQKEADDLWCEGVNLRTGRQGIFPSAYAVDLEYNDFDPNTQKVKKERYLLGYLGSVETMAHKGTGVVCQAVRKIVGEFGESPAGQLCILEISDQGLRMVDRSKSKTKEAKKPCIDYFYSLKNVSFCAFHPRDHRYIGFITKHPTIQRFACHVFKGGESTRPVAEAVGRAFQHFYQKFIETAYPIEDIYIE